MSSRKQHEQKLLRILISFHERYPAAGLDALVAMIKKIVLVLETPYTGL